MKLPKKITPDNIRDSIIEIRYTSKHPIEILMGYFFQVIGTDFKYTNRSLSKRKNNAPNLDGIAQQLVLSLSNPPLFLYNEKIKIQFQNKSIFYNCLEDYVSWEAYSPLIVDSLKRFHSTGMIESFDRVGVRYISEYKEKDMSPNINFSFSLSLNHEGFTNTVFKTEFISDSFRIILNLSNNISKSLIDKDKPATESLIDIDVIKDNLAIKEIDVLIDTIEKAHLKEKEIFFNLLKADFIKSLNPVY